MPRPTSSTRSSWRSRSATGPVRRAPRRGDARTTSAAPTGPISRCAPPRPRSPSGGRRGRRPTSRPRSAPSTRGATGSASGCSTNGSASSAARPATRSVRGPPRAAPWSSSPATRPRTAPRSSPRTPSCRCSTALLRCRSGSPATPSRSPAPADPPARDQEIHATTTLASRSPGAPTRTPRSSSSARPRRPHASSDDPDALFRVTANLTTVLDLVGRREEAVEVGVPRDRGRAAGRPGGGLRQLPRRQRHGVAVPARPLGGGAAPERAGPRLAAGRGRVPDGHRPARHGRDRDRRRASAPAACSGRRCSSSTPLREPQLAAPYYLAAASYALWRRRRRRCGPVRGARLGRGPRRPRSGSSPRA